jgi:hypothetical protein
VNQDQDINVNELSDEKKTEGLVKPLCQESDVPLFLRDSSEGQKCDPQDEKDQSVE